MDQHPIPQDVTGFQFKLIGTMTVKQFGYVACGVVMAVILYYMPLQSAFGILLKLVFIPLFGVSGVIVAFVPIDGRSIDVMATNFAKALFSPNQYVYRRQGRKLSFSSITISKAPTTQAQKDQVHGTASSVAAKKLDEKEEKLRAYLLSSHGGAKNEMDKKESAFLKTLSLPTIQPAISAVQPAGVKTSAPVIKQPITTAIKPALEKTQPTTAPLLIQKAAPAIAAAKPPIKTPEELAKKEVQLEKELTQAKQEAVTTTQNTQPTAAQQKVATLSKQIQDIHSEKERLEQELSHLKNQLTQQKSPTPAAPAAIVPSSNKKIAVQSGPVQPLQDPQHVRTIAQTVTKKAGLPHVSDTPNVVVGIVKDPRGNVLPNILVEVKDKDGNPVRAFKTNPLGQFASATPLGLGTYTIELDDPKKLHRFDIIQITANNQIMLPIEIISHDAREDLRKQLFAT